MRSVRITLAAGALVAAAALPVAGTVQPVAAVSHTHIDCEYSTVCADFVDSYGAYDHYVGHDEPSLLFYSNKPGSGNHMSYGLTLPTDPPANVAGNSYQFELNGAFWFGMAICDTQSYPEQVSTCTPDSDSNIVDPAVSPNHPGAAFMEMQFYPPGWVPWPAWAADLGASSCDPTKWCAALNIDSLSEDPVNGTFNNSACLNSAGLEYVNFAFVTKSGVSQAPADPLDATLTTFTPDPTKDLFMSSGDKLNVAFQDTAHGVQVVINDATSGQTGSMTASAANGFGQIKYDPTGTSCTALPYDFHPMYSTSSEQTRVPWAAHTYNVAFADEIGHFETCTGPNPIPDSPYPHFIPATPCPSGDSESQGEATDHDDNWCFPGADATLDAVNGCTDSNGGFDGLAYQNDWPDGSSTKPTPILFSSPRTGVNDTVQYQRMGFEADLAAIEPAPGCSHVTGTGCVNPPNTDEGVPVDLYPFFSDFQNGPGVGHNCLWTISGEVPGSTSDFGGDAEWGSLFSQSILIFGGGGASHQRFENFRQILANVPCRA